MPASHGPKPDHANFNVYPLLKRLFGEYLSTKQLTTEEAESVKLDDFVQFVLDDSTIPWSEICQQLNVDSVVKIDLLETLRKEGALPGMAAQWMGFIMGCRPMPKHPLGAIQVVVNLRFRDGKMTPMTCYIPEELSEPLSDAAVCLTVQQQMHAIYETVRSRGVDGLYDDGYFPDDKSVELRHKSQTPGPPVFPPVVVEQILAVRGLKGFESKCPPHRHAGSIISSPAAPMPKARGGFVVKPSNIEPLPGQQSLPGMGDEVDTEPGGSEN